MMVGENGGKFTSCQRRRRVEHCRETTPGKPGQVRFIKARRNHNRRWELVEGGARNDGKYQ